VNLNPLGFFHQMMTMITFPLIFNINHFTFAKGFKTEFQQARFERRLLNWNRKNAESVPNHSLVVAMWILDAIWKCAVTKVQRKRKVFAQMKVSQIGICQIDGFCLVQIFIESIE
jgi:hypothetical protein